MTSNPGTLPAGFKSNGSRIGISNSNIQPLDQNSIGSKLPRRSQPQFSYNPSNPRINQTKPANIPQYNQLQTISTSTSSTKQHLPRPQPPQQPQSYIPHNTKPLPPPPKPPVVQNQTSPQNDSLYNDDSEWAGAPSTFIQLDEPTQMPSPFSTKKPSLNTNEIEWAKANFPPFDAKAQYDKQTVHPKIQNPTTIQSNQKQPLLLPNKQSLPPQQNQHKISLQPPNQQQPRQSLPPQQNQPIQPQSKHQAIQQIKQSQNKISLQPQNQQQPRQSLPPQQNQPQIPQQSQPPQQIQQHLNQSPQLSQVDTKPQVDSKPLQLDQIQQSTEIEKLKKEIRSLKDKNNVLKKQRDEYETNLKKREREDNLEIDPRKRMKIEHTGTVQKPDQIIFNHVDTFTSLYYSQKVLLYSLDERHLLLEELMSPCSTFLVLLSVIHQSNNFCVHIKSIDRTSSVDFDNISDEIKSKLNKIYTIFSSLFALNSTAEQEFDFFKILVELVEITIDSSTLLLNLSLSTLHQIISGSYFRTRYTNMCGKLFDVFDNLAMKLSEKIMKNLPTSQLEIISFLSTLFQLSRSTVLTQILKQLFLYDSNSLLVNMKQNSNSRLFKTVSSSFKIIHELIEDPVFLNSSQTNILTLISYVFDECMSASSANTALAQTTSSQLMSVIEKIIRLLPEADKKQFIVLPRLLSQAVMIFNNEVERLKSTNDSDIPSYSTDVIIQAARLLSKSLGEKITAGSEVINIVISASFYLKENHYPSLQSIKPYAGQIFQVYSSSLSL